MTAQQEAIASLRDEAVAQGVAVSEGVLAVLDRAIAVSKETGGVPLTLDLCQSRASVAELIEAGQALQDAMDEHETGRFDAGPSQRFVDADARHRAALARVGGAS